MIRESIAAGKTTNQWISVVNTRDSESLSLGAKLTSASGLKRKRRAGRRRELSDDAYLAFLYDEEAAKVRRANAQVIADRIHAVTMG